MGSAFATGASMAGRRARRAGEHLRTAHWLVGGCRGPCRDASVRACAGRPGHAAPLGRIDLRDDTACDRDPPSDRGSAGAASGLGYGVPAEHTVVHGKRDIRLLTPNEKKDFPGWHAISNEGAVLLCLDAPTYGTDGMADIWHI